MITPRSFHDYFSKIYIILLEITSKKQLDMNISIRPIRFRSDIVHRFHEWESPRMIHASFYRTKNISDTRQHNLCQVTTRYNLIKHDSKILRLFRSNLAIIMDFYIVWIPKITVDLKWVRNSRTFSRNPVFGALDPRSETIIETTVRTEYLSGRALKWNGAWDYDCSGVVSVTFLMIISDNWNTLLLNLTPTSIWILRRDK